MGITKRVTLQDLGNAFEDMHKRRWTTITPVKRSQGSMLINQDSLDRRTFFMLLFWVANRIFQDGQTDACCVRAFRATLFGAALAVHIDTDIVSTAREQQRQHHHKSMKMIHRVFIIQ